MATLAVLPLFDDPAVALAGAPPHRDLCTDCGVSRLAGPSRCGTACQFIHPRYDALERQVHGRTRDMATDERWFGPFRAMWRARLTVPRPGAQWTGITTRLGERLLQTGAVDAVLATGSDPADRWRPAPMLIERATDMWRTRGMKMGFSPVLALLDAARARGHRRVAVIGVACQVHALRALEAELGFDAVTVIGTPCSDNTTTERFREFLALLTDRPDDVTYLEFLPDYRVELRFRDGAERHVPFVELPIAQLPKDFIPLTCRSCFDYTNALADITVGYMAGEGDQWVLVRTPRGQAALDLLGAEVVLAPVRSGGNRRGAVRAFTRALERQAGGMPVRRAPRWVKPLIGWAQRRFGPRGLEFARTRVEMKITEGIVNLRAERPRRLRRLVPDFAWAVAAAYGLAPRAGEHDGAPARGGAPRRSAQERT